jgi:hypothetical protein
MQTGTTELPFLLPLSQEMGKLNIMHLKRFWFNSISKRNGKILDKDLLDEWELDITLLSVLGLGLEPTIKYLFNENPTFSAFEDWILAVNDKQLPQQKIDHFNAQIMHVHPTVANNNARLLTDADLGFWNKNGYIILRNAVPKADCEATVELICKFLEIDINDAATWYQPHPAKQGIMVQLFQHPQLQKNRDSPKIKAAYEQLWQRKDIYVNTDRVGFNPPETETYHFPGPYLHWDVSLQLPIPFGLQGILYLVDTKANQGAFTLVPGFQNKIDSWINNLPKGANPRTQDFKALGAMPIAANAGDFILWHQALPHGSSPNTAQLPRIVQYINYNPINPEFKSVWK